MKRGLFPLFSFLVLVYFPPLSSGKELPKIAVWDPEPRNTPQTHAMQLTSFVVSEITKLKKFEVYSQENVGTLAGSIYLRAARHEHEVPGGPRVDRYCPTHLRKCGEDRQVLHSFPESFRSQRARVDE